MNVSPQLKRYFTTGLLALLPAAAAMWVIMWLFRWVERIALSPLFEIGWISRLFDIFPEALKPWLQGLIALLIMFIAISSLGLLATNVVGKWFLGLLDNFMKKVPLASNVYSFVQGLVENLRYMQVGYFQKVVLVQFPRNGIWSLGFISGKLEGDIQSSIPGEHMAVFVPTSPNPTSGFIVVVAASDVITLDISPEEGLKFVMSGGVLMPGTSNVENPGN